MNKILENITPILTDIKLKKCIYAFTNEKCYSLGDTIESFVIKSNPKSMGYRLGGYNTLSINRCDYKVKIPIDNKNIFITTSNILLLPFYRVAIDLNSKKIYRCSPKEFKALKQHLKTVKEILISNE